MGDSAFTVAARKNPLRPFVVKRPHLETVIREAPELWQALNKEADDYVWHRLQETFESTGAASAGVANLIRLESEAFTDAAYLRAMALKTLEWVSPCDSYEDQAAVRSAARAMVKDAHALNTLARGHAIAARNMALSESPNRGKKTVKPRPLTHGQLLDFSDDPEDGENENGPEKDPTHNPRT